MSLLTTETLEKRLASLIKPANAGRLKSGAYELALGPEVFVTNEKTKRQLSQNEQIEIPPGQFALLITEETIKVPADLAALISIKANIKFRGLVNVSGFHVDPGFEGRLKFSVYNAGGRPILMTRSQPFFLIWFLKLDRKTKHVYSGDKMNQMSISDEDVMRLRAEIPSPLAMDKELKDLQVRIQIVEKENKTVRYVFLGIMIALIANLIAPFMSYMLDKKSPARNGATIENAQSSSAENTGTPIKEPVGNKKVPK